MSDGAVDLNGSEQDRKTQWHPGYCGAIKLEFREDKERIRFITEFALSSKPLVIDMIAILLEPGAKLRNEIGEIFRGFNILEFKSPGDHMGVDAYFALMSYAYRLKLKGPDDKPLDPDEITLTLIRREKPKALMKFLTEKGMMIIPAHDGIYRVEGHQYFPLQILVTREMRPSEHVWLASLRRDMTHEGKRAFISGLDELFRDCEADDRDNADAVFSIVYTENRSLIEHDEEGAIMSDVVVDALINMNRDKFAAIFAEREAHGIAQGIERGIAQGMAGGIISMGRKFGMSAKDIVSELITNLSCTRTEAERMLAEA